MDETKSLEWRSIARYGLIGGVIALYVSAIGMVETFAQRNLIGTLLSLGIVILVGGAIGAGYLAANVHRKQGTLLAIGAGLATGLLSSIPLIILIAVTQFISLRSVFINISPGLITIVTLGQGPFTGSLLLAILSGIMGVVGTAFVLLPRRWIVALLSGTAWTLGIGLFSENVGQILQENFGRGIVRILFQNRSLNPIAAIIIFAITFAVGYFRLHEKVQDRWSAIPANQQKQGRIVGLVLGILLLIYLPWGVGLFLSQALFVVGYFIMMGLGLNIVVGYAGLLDLGYVAFFAFGAYIMGVLTTTGDLAIGNFNFWTALPISVLAGVAWGVILGFPVLRMRGDYLAIVTLGFGEIIRILALSDWLAPIEGGAQGVLHIPNPQIFGITLGTPQTMYYLVILGSLLAAFVTIRLRDSRLGRQWMAMREDEDVAEAMGINLVQTKLLAFAIGAAFSSMAGAIFAARLGNIFPHSFNLLISLNALALIIVGGMGSIPGVVVGALILVGLPELLREFAEYRLLMYGILLIIMMLAKPEGFIPEARRKRELHHGEDELFEGALEVTGD